MGKLLVAPVVGVLLALLLSERVRREAGELARDISDLGMMWLLRATSGFAADVPTTLLQEERERRLRWR